MSAGDVRYAARHRSGCADYATEEQARDLARALFRIGGIEEVHIEKWTSDGQVYQPEHIETLRARPTEP